MKKVFDEIVALPRNYFQVHLDNQNVVCNGEACDRWHAKTKVFKC
jgi:hypothetical protein